MTFLKARFHIFIFNFYKISLNFPGAGGSYLQNGVEYPSPYDYSIYTDYLKVLYRTTKTASVRINLGVITFRSLSKRTLAAWLRDEIRHPVNRLARYESLTSPDLHHDRAVTLSLSPPSVCAPPTQD